MLLLPDVHTVNMLTVSYVLQNHQTPLHCACCYNDDVNVVKILVEKKADVNAKDKVS